MSIINGELPKGWRIARFDEILKRVERKIIIDDSATYDCVGVRWYGIGAFVREQELGMNIARKQQWVIKSGDVVYNKLFAWKGSFAIAHDAVDGCIVSDKFPTYRLDPQLVEQEFLRYYFLMPVVARQAQDLSKGAAAISKLTLNPPQFWDLTIPLPPLAEQRRIVARIEALAGKITEAHNLRQQAAQEADALLGGILDQVIGALANKHAAVTLIDLVDPDRGISYGVVLTGTPNEDGVPTLRAGDLQKYHVLINNVKRIDPIIEQKYQRTRLKGNELLLRIRGGFGEVAVTPPEMIGGNVSREIAVIPFNSKVLPKYGMYVLSSPASQTRMTEHLRGTSYLGINLKDVRMLKMPLPPLSEQHCIVAHLDALQARVAALHTLQAATAAELAALLPAVLDRAFKGEL